MIESDGIHDLTGLKGYIEGLSKICIPQMTIEDAPTKDNDKLYTTGCSHTQRCGGVPPF